MIRSLTFILLICGVWAVPPTQNKCTARTWQLPPNPLVEECPHARSWQSESIPPGEYDEGHYRMTEIMKFQRAQRELVRRCRQEGTCPEFDIPAKASYAECEDGLADYYDCMNMDRWSFTPIEELNGHDPRDMSCNDIWGWHDDVSGDDIAIVGLTGGTSFVRVNDPANPVVLGFMHTIEEFNIWRDMKVNRDHAYIVSEGRVHGMQVFDLTRLREVEDFQIFEPDVHYDKFGNAHNIAVNQETDHVYVVGARSSGWEENCASLGGLFMIDVSEPLNPMISGCFDTDGYTHDVECIIYRGPDNRYVNHEICFGYNEDSLTIVDVTSKQNPQQISRTEYEYYGYTHQGWITDDHTLILLDDEADESQSDDGHTRTLIWDVRDLDNPVLQHTYCSTEKSTDHNQYIRRFHAGEENQYDLVFQSNYRAGVRILLIDEENYDLHEVAYHGMFQNRTEEVSFSGSWSNYIFWEDPEKLAATSIDFGLFMLRPDYNAIEDAIGC